MSFKRLVRVLAKDGRRLNGDAILPEGVTDARLATQARVLKGRVLGQSRVTDEIVDIGVKLCPITPASVCSVRCLGLNYAGHAAETGLSKPPYPIVFHKPATTIAAPEAPIPIPLIVQLATEMGLDYECELVVIIGRMGRDIDESKALNHVLGYAVGNDVSHRGWQLKRGGGQWSHGKSFDKWAPMGPCIVNASEIPDPQKLKMWTKVNGKVVQDSTTADMIFPVSRIISFLSQGVTLLPGDVIFTGTPAGVGMSRKPPLWLKHGDVVEVGIDQIGTCLNAMQIVDEGKDKSKKRR